MEESASYPVEKSESTSAISARPSSSKSSRSALLIVFLVMFIDLLGFGIVLPLLPRYGKEFLEPLFPGYENAKLRGAILGLLLASFSAMQFLFAPVWGRLSDRAGRRPFLLLGLAGSVIFYALFGFASDWGIGEGRLAIGLGLLFVARMGAGIAGATVSTAQAVIADCTTPEKRSHGMALIGAAFGIGFTFGPMLGFGAVYFFPQYQGGPGYVASALSLSALVLALALMPETLRPGLLARQRSWFNVHGLRLAIQTPSVGILMLSFFFSTLAFASFEPTLALLTQDILGYGDRDNFLIFAYVGLVLALAQGFLYRRLARRGVSEQTFMFVGIFLMILGLGGLGWLSKAVAPEAIELYRYFGSVFMDVGPGKLVGLALLGKQPPSLGPWLLTGFLAAITVAVIGYSFVTPSVQALISRRSDPAKQGEILGVNQSVNAMSRILGPMAGISLYYFHFTHVLPYVLSVCLLILALLLTFRVTRT